MANGGPKPKKSISLRTVIITSSLAALLLLIANSAFWFNNYIFNTSNFTQTTSVALLSQSSREALATEVVDRALQNRPALQRGLGEPATKLIAGLLDSSIAQTVVERSITRLQIAITSKDPQSIELNLEPIKETLTKVLDVAGQISDQPIDENRFNPDDIPNTITLVDASTLPNIYVMGTVLLWVGPLSLLAAIALLAYPLYRHRQTVQNLPRTLSIQATAIALGWIAALLIGPLFKPPILAQVPDANLRVVVENVYNAFIATFSNQTATMLMLAILFAIAAAGSWYYQSIYLPKQSNSSNKT